MFQLNVSFNLGKLTNEESREVVVKNITENEITFMENVNEKGCIVYTPCPDMKAIYKLWIERLRPYVLDCSNKMGDISIPNPHHKKEDVDIYTE